MTRAAAVSLALALLIAGCTAPTPPHKAPPPPPAPKPAPVAPSEEPEWRDMPLAPGTWTYAAETGGTVARFGQPGQPAALLIRCDASTRTIRIVRPGGTAGPMTITTSYSGRDWPASASPEGAVVSLGATDPFLDRLAFSRGRFSIAAPGAPLLLVPAWAEPARVIEDCRRPLGAAAIS